MDEENVAREKRTGRIVYGGIAVLLLLCAWRVLGPGGFIYSGENVFEMSAWKGLATWLSCWYLGWAVIFAGIRLIRSGLKKPDTEEEGTDEASV